MGSTKNSATVFDDDFEVTYEEDIPFSYSFDTKPVSNGATDETVVMDADDDFEYDERDSEYDADEYDIDDDADQYDDVLYDEGVYPDEDDYDYDRDAPRRKRAKRKSSGTAGRLLSPVRKTARYGTKAIYRTARSVVRIISALITAGTFCVLAYNFWRGAAPYGDPMKILTDRNYALAAYAGVAAVILLFELISFFWSLTKMRFREGRKIYKEDTGRGLFSFIFIYITSYLSFLLCSFLPDTLGSYDVLNGLKGALDVFGSLHNVLLGLCLAGVVACLVRRHMN